MRSIVAWLALAGGVGACADQSPTLPPIPSGDPARFAWNLPAGFPVPMVPADNPMSDAKVELGRRLFYDTRLSGNQQFSCSSCHRQENAFADARNIPFGSTGEPHPRNSMGLTNVAYQPALGWADPNTRQLERQALIPMFGDHPVELGLKGQEGELVTRLAGVDLYRRLFAASFPGDPDPVTLDHVTKAIAAFERTFFSASSPYDRASRGEAAAMSDAAHRGESLFRSDRLKCAQCHAGTLFTKFAEWSGAPQPGPEFVNNGLYNLSGSGAYPAPNTGLYAISGVPTDMGRFKVPTLRNIAVTFPYMHDGSLGSLSDVVDHYAAGGRTIASGPNAGNGSRNPYKSPLVSGFVLTAAEKVDLIAFLESLTDSVFLRDARLANPWIRNP